MANPDETPPFLAYLLIPDATRQHVLVATGVGSQAQPAEPLILPSLSFGAEPELPELLEAMGRLAKTTVLPLRIRYVAEEPDSGAAHSAGANRQMLLVELDAGLTEAPGGYAWSGIDAQATGELTPASARPAVAAWVDERDHGWSPQRPAWARSGWHGPATAWMVEQMSAAGQPATSEPRLHRLWDLSVLLVADSERGRVFLKCSADIFRQEAVITQALAAQQPDLLPEVIAIEPHEGWLLMRDLGADEIGDQDEELWFEGVVALAGLQHEWLGRTEELAPLGLPPRSLPALAQLVHSWSEDDALLSRMPAELRARWKTAAPELEEDCLRLDGIGPGTSILHGDFHPGNVSYGDGRVRIFDWTDACTSHPFIDLATYVYRTKRPDVRRQLMDSYLACWQEHLSATDLAEAGRLALVVGALNQVQTYRLLGPTLMAGHPMDGDVILWVKRALNRREQGLGSPT